MSKKWCDKCDMWYRYEWLHNAIGRYVVFYELPRFKRDLE